MTRPSEVRVLCRPEIGSGFALAGLRTVAARNAEEGRARMQELLASPEVGVVLVEETQYDAFPDELRRQIGRHPLPMVVPFPEPAWEEGREPSEEYIVELLRQVIGYRVRLR